MIDILGAYHHLLHLNVFVWKELRTELLKAGAYVNRRIAA